MLQYAKFVLAAIALVLLLGGCSFTREPVRARDDYFNPLNVVPQRNRTIQPFINVDQLKNQLKSATEAAMALRDSLTRFQKYAGLLLTSTRTLVDKVSELEMKELLSSTQQKNLEKNIAQLQSENKQLSQQITELKTKVLAGGSAESSVFVPTRTISSLHMEYADALSLFQRRQYENARALFGELINKGIEEDLADNCEYWMGECSFARREYKSALQKFEKVIAMPSSNKKADAYYMMGRSYETLGNTAKARWAYEELLAHFPLSEHAYAARQKTESLKSTDPMLHRNKPRKTTA